MAQKHDLKETIHDPGPKCWTFQQDLQCDSPEYNSMSFKHDPTSAVTL
jgi:hypothetical protein